eukprot:TRINITY_DN2789_c0_g1_i1.p1 TRINITY_DN2789_c0_g1~~TRINITY_DN2789_c0_g1_i1.p1  ORF type:complete len:797 (+),score=133.14 TRINITY_DN2789_c0_g1_i1:104-2494(+)
MKKIRRKERKESCYDELEWVQTRLSQAEAYFQRTMLDPHEAVLKTFPSVVIASTPTIDITEMVSLLRTTDWSSRWGARPPRTSSSVRIRKRDRKRSRKGATRSSSVPEPPNPSRIHIRSSSDDRHSRSTILSSIGYTPRGQDLSEDTSPRSDEPIGILAEDVVIITGDINVISPTTSEFLSAVTPSIEACVLVYDIADLDSFEACKLLYVSSVLSLPYLLLGVDFGSGQARAVMPEQRTHWARSKKIMNAEIVHNDVEDLSAIFQEFVLQEISPTRHQNLDETSYWRNVAYRERSTVRLVLSHLLSGLANSAPDSRSSSAKRFRRKQTKDRKEDKKDTSRELSDAFGTDDEREWRTTSHVSDQSTRSEISENDFVKDRETPSKDTFESMEMAQNSYEDDLQNDIRERIELQSVSEFITTHRPFRDYLTSLYCVELIDCYETLKDFSQTLSVDEEEAVAIYDLYIDPSSPKQVNLPSLVMKKAQTLVQRNAYSSAMFDDVLEETEKMITLHRRSYYISPVFSTYLKETVSQALCKDLAGKSKRDKKMKGVLKKLSAAEMRMRDEYREELRDKTFDEHIQDPLGYTSYHQFLSKEFNSDVLDFYVGVKRLKATLPEEVSAAAVSLYQKFFVPKAEVERPSSSMPSFSELSTGIDASPKQLTEWATAAKEGTLNVNSFDKVYNDLRQWVLPDCWRRYRGEESSHFLDFVAAQVDDYTQSLRKLRKKASSSNFYTTYIAPSPARKQKPDRNRSSIAASPSRSVSFVMGRFDVSPKRRSRDSLSPTSSISIEERGAEKKRA